MARMARFEGLAGDVQQLLDLGTHRADGQRHRRVAAPAVDLAAGVDRDDVAFLERAAVGDAVDHVLVDAGADHRRERRLPLDRAGIAQEQRGRVVLAEDRGDGRIHLGGGDARHGHPPDLVERLGHHPARLAHQGDLARALELDYRGRRFDARAARRLRATPQAGQQREDGTGCHASMRRHVAALLVMRPDLQRPTPPGPTLCHIHYTPRPRRGTAGPDRLASQSGGLDLPG